MAHGHRMVVTADCEVIALESLFHQPKHFPKWDQDCYLPGGKVIIDWSTVNSKPCLVLLGSLFHAWLLKTLVFTQLTVLADVLLNIFLDIIYQQLNCDVRFWNLGMATSIKCLYLSAFLKHADGRWPM